MYFGGDNDDSEKIINGGCVHAGKQTYRHTTYLWRGFLSAFGVRLTRIKTIHGRHFGQTHTYPFNLVAEDRNL